MNNHRHTLLNKSCAGHIEGAIYIEPHGQLHKLLADRQTLEKPRGQQDRVSIDQYMLSNVGDKMFVQRSYIGHEGEQQSLHDEGLSDCVETDSSNRHIRPKQTVLIHFSASCHKIERIVNQLLHIYGSGYRALRRSQYIS